MHGVAIRRVPLATSDITEMMHFVASDTRLVRWCFTAHYVLGYSNPDDNTCRVGCYIEVTLELPSPR